jgi:hypothetical protein
MANCRALIIEDEYFLARDLEDAFRSLGVTVIALSVIWTRRLIRSRGAASSSLLSTQTYAGARRSASPRN